MSELPDARTLLEAAEQAAIADDLASADELLRSAARLQEAELGSLHPDLANTLNNLAIVAEKTGRLDDAETFYRRAVAITSASFPVDHPIAAASRENFEDFCRAHGLSIDTPAVMAGPPETPTGVGAADAGPTVEAPPPPSDLPILVPRQRAPVASEPVPPAPRRVSRSIAWAAIGVAVVVIAMFVVRRPGTSQEASTPAPAAEPASPPRTELPAPTAPIEQPRPTTVVPRSDDRVVPADKPAVPSPSSGAIVVVTAELCRTFSTSGANWRCDPAVDPVPPGSLVLYTRVRSARDTVVVHRWYRGETLRQSVKLTIRANATEGYRTYSRQTVGGPADWRVEVTGATGDLLHELRFAVR